MNLRRRVFRVNAQLAVGLVAFSISTGALSADVITVADSTFLLANWSSNVEFSSNGASESNEHRMAGGNPDEFRFMMHDLDPGPAQISVSHMFLGATYNPSVQGAIESIDYSEDQIEFDPPFSGAAIGALPALFQDGQIFVGPDITFNNLTWQTTALNGLTASDFSAGVLNPDFSLSGGQITFGFVRSNSNTGSSGRATQHGIDNWSFTLHTTAIPEPASGGLLCMIAATFACGWRNRKA